MESIAIDVLHVSVDRKTDLLLLSAKQERILYQFVFSCYDAAEHPIRDLTHSK